MLDRTSLLIVVASIACGLVPSAARGQDRMGSWLNPRFGELGITGGYGVDYACRRDVDQPQRGLRIIRHNAWLQAPVFQDEGQEFSLRARAAAWDLDGRLTLPDKGVSVGDHLWDAAVGVTYRWKLDNDWIAGVDAEVGSASDEPFHSVDEWTVRAGGWLSIPAGERDAWLFMLSYANARDFLPHVPLPGVAYSWHATPELHWLIGFPFTRIRWEPLDRLELAGSYFFPRRIHARVGYRILEDVKVYGGYDWDYDRWFRAGRADDDDRLFYYEQRLTAGVRWDVTENVYMDLNGGFAFDRFFFEGEDYDDRCTDRVNVGDGLFAGLRVGFRF